jgi:uncharacterized protein GlcG (DUF336 family)
MGNVVTKHSISSELAQKMIDQAMAKARQMGVAENIAILDDGGNLKAFSRMDGAPILSIEIAQNKAYTGSLVHDQPNMHRPSEPKRESRGGYESDQGVAKQSACPRGLRYALQQERLCGR